MTKRYDTAQIPYRRLLASDALAEDQMHQLAARDAAASPLNLKVHIEQTQGRPLHPCRSRSLRFEASIPVGDDFLLRLTRGNVRHRVLVKVAAARAWGRGSVRRGPQRKAPGDRAPFVTDSMYVAGDPPLPTTTAPCYTPLVQVTQSEVNGVPWASHDPKPAQFPGRI